MNVKSIFQALFIQLLCVGSIGIGIILLILFKRGILFRKGKSTVAGNVGANGSMQTCPACGASNPADNHFCDKCGTKLGN